MRSILLALGVLSSPLPAMAQASITPPEVPKAATSSCAQIDQFEMVWRLSLTAASSVNDWNALVTYEQATRQYLQAAHACLKIQIIMFDHLTRDLKIPSQRIIDIARKSVRERWYAVTVDDPSALPFGPSMNYMMRLLADNPARLNEKDFEQVQAQLSAHALRIIKHLDRLEFVSDAVASMTDAAIKSWNKLGVQILWI
ncbi:hypothetical protein HYV73_01850 [Candidatus Uhrbacteria bacterium]|nr:hypothetical protein [Candidatus Uhrbacteria bacterium]